MHEFTGQWITDEEFCDIEPHDAYGAASDYDSALNDAHVLFRKKFWYDGEKPTRLFYCADDYCKIYINGKFVTCGPAPSYPFAMNYACLNITKYLCKGENVIAFHTYYQGLVNRVWVSGDNRHGLLFDIVSGTGLAACSDESVKVRRHGGYKKSHTTGYDTQYIDDYDSRAAEVGFQKAEFDDSNWGYAIKRKVADYAMRPQKSKQLAFERLVPEISVLPSGNAVYDFKREFVGYPEITARGNAGDGVEIYCGEELDSDGSVRYDMRCNCIYREKWTLSGGLDEFEPFDYKAFRYMEIKKPQSCEIISAFGKARRYPFSLKAKPEFGDEKLRRVFDLCVDTLRYGIQEGYLDCPSREKGQYFGDGVWSSLTHVALTGDKTLYKKFVCDAFDSTRLVEGGTAQGPCSFLQLIAEFPLMVVISLKYYTFLTGDRAFAEKKRDEAKAVLQYYARKYADESGLVSVYDRWNVVEWPHRARDGYDFDLSQNKLIYGKHNVMNAYWYFAVKAYEELYGKYSEFDSEKIKRAYADVFFDATQGVFYDSESSKHSAIASQLMGVLTGVAQDGKAQARLLGMIREKRLSASNLFITPVMFLWLRKSGNEELLYDLIKDEGAWLNMLEEGATTTFEAFSKDGKENASLCHTMFAFPALFIINIEKYPT